MAVIVIAWKCCYAVHDSDLRYRRNGSKGVSSPHKNREIVSATAELPVPLAPRTVHVYVCRTRIQNDINYHTCTHLRYVYVYIYVYIYIY